MKKEIQVCRASSSVSSVLGNVSFIVRDYIEGLFPKDFFKSIYVDTKMMNDEMAKDDIMKKAKPFLVIKPRFSLDDGNTFFQRLPDWMCTNYFIYTNLRESYSPVFVDFEKEIFLYSVPDRIRIDFDIDMYFPTRMQQLNAAWFFKGSTLFKSYFYLNDAKLETEVPKYYVNLLSKTLGYDLTNKQSHDEFMKYLDKGSQSFITEKMKASTGNPSFFYIFSPNILSMFQDYPTLDDGDQNAQVSDNFKVSAQFSAEFWCPLNFILEVNTQATPIQPDKPTADEISLNDTTVTVNVALGKSVPSTVNGMDMVKKYAYISGDTAGLDELDLAPVIDWEIQDIIAKNIKYGVDNNTFFKVDVYSNTSKLPDEDVKVDWKRLVLQNLKAEPDTCYHFFLYQNTYEVNKRVYEIQQADGAVYQD